MITNQSITVDLMRRNSPIEKIYCKQNDSKSRNIRLSISENGVPITDLTAPAKVYYEDYKYRSLCYQDVQITNGVAEFTIVQTALSVSGEVRAELQILNADDEQEILSSATFIIDCDRQVNLSGRAGGDGKDVLETMVEKAVQGAVDNKVDKEEGKQLSTNDYTTADKELVQSIPNKANTSDVNDALENKVDKIPGKGLSTNDYTSIDKMMVDTISGKANVITVNEQLAKKQDKLTAGTNITIEGNVISATGGGSGTVDQRFNPTSTNAQSGIAVHEAVAPATSKANNALNMLGDVPEDTDIQTEIDNLDERVTYLEEHGGGGGTTNYSLLTNKPQINSVELNGNKSLSDLGIQPALVSGTSIKTINNQSILGAGNINIQGGGGDTDEIYSILRIMKTILKASVFTSDQQSNFVALENLLPDGVIEDGDALIIRSGVTVVEDGDALQIS